MLIEKLKRMNICDENTSRISSRNILHHLMQVYGKTDGRWICCAISSALALHEDIRSRKRSLRLPPTLTDKKFVKYLREAGAIEALHRFSFLTRLTKLIENALDRVISGNFEKKRTSSYLQPT